MAYPFAYVHRRSWLLLRDQTDDFAHFLNVKFTLLPSKSLSFIDSCLSSHCALFFSLPLFFPIGREPSTCTNWPACMNSKNNVFWNNACMKNLPEYYRIIVHFFPKLHNVSSNLENSWAGFFSTCLLYNDRETQTVSAGWQALLILM